MTADEIIQFWEEQASLFGNGLEVALTSGDRYLIVLNLEQVFKARVMQGLVSWRFDRDPTNFFQEAEVVMGRGRNCLELGQIPRGELPLENSGYIASLLGRSHEAIDLEGLESDRLLDARIVNALLGHHPFTDQSSLIQTLRSRVARETYQLYSDLLLGNLDANDGAKRGEELFKGRRSDEFYSGAEMLYGGGEANAEVVDYALAAILKKLGYQGPSMHRWRWS